MSISTYASYGSVRWLGGAGGLSSGTRAQNYGLAIGPGGRIVYDVIDLSQAANDFVGSMSSGVSDAAATHSALSNAVTPPGKKIDTGWRTSEFPNSVSAPWTPVESPRQDNALVYFVEKNYSQDDMRGVNFDGAEMSGSNFSRSDLTGANLSYTKLDNANFDAADLAGARFDYADVTGASFIGADLRGADLSKALGLTAAQLSTAMYDTTTALPDSLSYLTVSAPPVGLTSGRELTTSELESLYAAMYA